jgi:hypothetical protein
MRIEKCPIYNPLSRPNFNEIPMGQNNNERKVRQCSSTMLRRHGGADVSSRMCWHWLAVSGQQLLSRLEEYYLLGYNGVQPTESQPKCEKDISHPSSGLKNELSKKPTSSRWQVELQTTWHYIPENSTLHNHCCENLKSYLSRHLSSYTVCGL